MNFRRWKYRAIENKKKIEGAVIQLATRKKLIQMSSNVISNCHY
jgi:hypothetical protein